MAISALPPGTVADEFVASRLGRPVWRIADVDGRHLGDVVREAQRSSVGLLSCRIDADDDLGAGALAVAGFRAVGRLVTFRLALDTAAGLAATGGVRDAREADLAVCREIARTSFATDRFHTDPRFPDDVADDLKAAWVANAFAGRADRVLVCEREGRVVGFNLCLWRPPVAIIDLIAVAAEARARGVGVALIAAMAALARTEGLEAIEAGTQDDNAPACALYRRLGFVPVRNRIDFHWTPDPA